MNYYYYITNSTDPDGMFEVTKAIRGQDEPYNEFYMIHWGNYFRDKENAKKMCKKLNRVLHRNGIRTRDRDGNKIYIGDKVMCINDGIMGEITSMSPDGTMVNINIDEQFVICVDHFDIIKYTE